MKRNPDDSDSDSDPKPEMSPDVSTRRMAIKRIATIVTGAAAGTGILGRAKEAWGQYSSRYTSIGRTYGSSYYTSTYRDTVYGSYQPRYSSSSVRFLPPPAIALRDDAPALSVAMVYRLIISGPAGDLEDAEYPSDLSMQSLVPVLLC